MLILIFHACILNNKYICTVWDKYGFYVSESHKLLLRLKSPDMWLCVCVSLSGQFHKFRGFYCLHLQC